VGVRNVEVVNQKIEELAEGSVSNAIARGLAPLGSCLVKYRKIFAPGGRFFHFKTAAWSNELARCPSQVFSIWDVELVDSYELIGSGRVNAIVRSQKR